MKKKKNTKMLYKSKNNRIISGVCGGIGEYLQVDPTIIRLLWGFSILFMGLGVWAYIFSWIIIPEK